MRAGRVNFGGRGREREGRGGEARDVGAWLGAGEWLERWRAAAFGTRFRFHLFRRGAATYKC